MESSIHAQHQEGHVVVVKGPRLGLPDLARAKGWLGIGKKRCAWAMVWATTYMMLGKLLELNFKIAVDEVIEYSAAKIGAAEDKVSSEQTAECKVTAEGRMAIRKPKVIQAAK
ncbi:xyloglucan galactosyltransferase KATAMARI1-like [Pyrus ussuriensis x Pyrus communis]|uniref:Xyloglucan galactosyltransferase KATAMARI1-like n=1 Tax=Pyrus ussuriensis x Pyrus communis TaxID=2448454 RepID=A0A5N5FLV0_9ROSA|nr:xyloglucan galactosyltransferase KATAMARI1-like [Pyrus ussuriensis x Pyrus communis]